MLSVRLDDLDGVRSPDAGIDFQSTCRSNDTWGADGDVDGKCRRLVADHLPVVSRRHWRYVAAGRHGEQLYDAGARDDDDVLGASIEPLGIRRLGLGDDHGHASAAHRKATA